MRALEFATPVVRVTNNGITAIIDSSGEVKAQLPQNVADVLQHELVIVESATPYKRFGNALGWGLLLLITITVYARRKQAK